MRLLIADSDPTLWDIYERFFSREGYEVELVGDGLEVLSRFKQQRPELAVLMLSCHDRLAYVERSIQLDTAG